MCLTARILGQESTITTLAYSLPLAKSRLKRFLFVTGECFYVCMLKDRDVLPLVPFLDIVYFMKIQSRSRRRVLSNRKKCPLHLLLDQ